jgi:hypothetical protein
MSDRLLIKDEKQAVLYHAALKTWKGRGNRFAGWQAVKKIQPAKKTVVWSVSFVWLNKTYSMN